MKSMCRHKTITGLPKYCPNNLNQLICTICYTQNMTTFPKETTVHTTNLQPGELIHMYFSFWNLTSIHGFTSMLTVVCAKTRMIWLFHTVSKIDPVRIILFVLTTINNEQHPCKCVRVDEYVTFSNWTDVTNFTVYYINILMKTTGGDPTKHYPS